MAYGARESNSREGTGLALFIAGLIAFAADWAYAGGVIQVIFIILGLAGVVGGIGIMRSARTAG
ncbi:MAG: hypothetical protein ACYDAG_01460 [Chloroflexota bacterium]